MVRAVCALAVLVGAAAARAEQAAPAGVEVTAQTEAAPTGPASLATWTDRVVTRLVAASLARVPPLVPPTPVAVAWDARRRASIDVGGPLAGVAVADLDADGRDELYLATDDALIAYDLGATPAERARVALPPELPATRPRESIAVMSVVPATAAAPTMLAVRSGSRARGARYALRDGALVEAEPVADFPLCAGDARPLVPGRNHFGSVGAPVYAVVCRTDLVAKDGAPLHVTATLGAGGELKVEVRVVCRGADCVAPPPSEFVVDDVGVGLQIADLDRDGSIEIVAGGDGAPGDADVIRVIRAGAPSAKKPWFKRAFLSGVVAAAVGDFDGDGDEEALAATRLQGATRIDLWQLNK